MFENYKKTHIKSLENMNIVYYEQPEHVDILAYGVKGKLGLGSSIAPFQFVRNFFYRDLRQFSNCIVRVTPQGTVAQALFNSDPIIPSEKRNIMNSKYVIVSCVITSAFLYRKGYGLVKRVIKNMVK